MCPVTRGDMLSCWGNRAATVDAVALQWVATDDDTISNNASPLELNSSRALQVRRLVTVPPVTPSRLGADFEWLTLESPSAKLGAGKAPITAMTMLPPGHALSAYRVADEVQEVPEASLARLRENAFIKLAAARDQLHREAAKTSATLRDNERARRNKKPNVKQFFFNLGDYEIGLVQDALVRAERHFQLQVSGNCIKLATTFLERRRVAAMFLIDHPAFENAKVPPCSYSESWAALPMAVVLPKKPVKVLVETEIVSLYKSKHVPLAIQGQAGMAADS
ncbi:hypothetical protein DYB37_011093 [Aphanomyces astaci]|uniref:Uncharacterized protein n=1 Tax=Aphanomyces astaci TaxID=112090 RepID=A0A3R7BJI0_APHAT|nr:hypothetical protein DYB37_011093 [Aphanomyces astaci]